MAALSRSAGSPGPGTAVTADGVVAAVRVHLDRVHDAVRRLGCTPAVAVDVVETSAVELVEVVAATPEAVPDLVGWWFARARERGQAAATTADAPLGGGLLSVDDDQRRVADALEQLPEQERVALLLRDSYDLPASSVGAVVGLDPEGAAALVARARLALLPLVDDEPAPAVASHVKDLGALGRLGEARPVVARDATVRRHALSCAPCRAVTDAQQRVHLRLSGLTVVALPDEARTRVLSRVDRTARRLLPPAAGGGAVAPAPTAPAGAPAQEASRLTPLLVVLSVLLAALVGIGAGLVLGDQEEEREPLAGADGQLPATVPLLSPAASPPPPASPPTVPEVRPRTTVVVITPPPPSPPPPPPSPSPSPAAPLSLEVSPESGPNGTQLTVTGTGFLPSSEVTVDYLDVEGQPTGSQAIVETDETGAFTTELAAQDPANEPGPHEVVATDGETITSALFTAEE